MSDDEVEPTSGPWEVVDEQTIVEFVPEESVTWGRFIADLRHVHGDPEEHEQAMADARRIVACVNFCEGVSTEVLEKLNGRGITLERHRNIVESVLSEIAVKARPTEEQSQRLPWAKVASDCIVAARATMGRVKLDYKQEYQDLYPSLEAEADE